MVDRSGPTISDGQQAVEERAVALERHPQVFGRHVVAAVPGAFELAPVARNNVAICTNISCWLNGAEDVVRYCEKKLGTKLGESTADGRIYLKREEECLAACAGAPMMVVNGHYHERLTPESIDKIRGNRINFDSLLSDLEAYDIADFKFPHPYFGPINAVEWLVMAGGHELRHLRQIERLLEHIRHKKAPVRRRVIQPG